MVGDRELGSFTFLFFRVLEPPNHLSKMAISRSLRNRRFKKLDDEFSSHACGVFLPVAMGGEQVEGFSWLEADRFAQKGCVRDKSAESAISVHACI